MPLERCRPANPNPFAAPAGPTNGPAGARCAPPHPTIRRLRLREEVRDDTESSRERKPRSRSEWSRREEPELPRPATFGSARFFAKPQAADRAEFRSWGHGSGSTAARGGFRMKPPPARPLSDAASRGVGRMPTPRGAANRHRPPPPQPSPYKGLEAVQAVLHAKSSVARYTRASTDQNPHEPSNVALSAIEAAGRWFPALQALRRTPVRFRDAAASEVTAPKKCRT